MVLPEGVLNTSNLQKIREYFEGKAKIILICSIPQDVFIAAGATVKPSLVFFKRFTEEEELQYLGAKTRAEKEIRQKYIGQIKALQEKIVEEKSKKLKVKALIAVAEKELRDLEKAIIEEAKPLTKEYFDYEIPKGRKQQIYNLFAEYCKFDRQMVVATHSPILAQLANEKELLMLDHEGGKSTLLTEEKIDKIKHLTGTSWDVIGQGICC